MKKTILFAVAALAAMAPESASGSGSDRQAKASPSPFMRVYGPTSPPIGHVQFCERMPEHCLPDDRGEARIELIHAFSVQLAVEHARDALRRTNRVRLRGPVRPSCAR